MDKKKADESESERIPHLAHGLLLSYMFMLFEQIEGKKFTKSKLRKLMRRVEDLRVIGHAMKGLGIHESSAEDIAYGLTTKMEKIIDEIGGVGKFTEELKRSLELTNVANSFQWLEDRILGKPPYIRKGDIILNRNDRHLIDDYNITLAIGPSPGNKVEIKYADKPTEIFKFESMALLKYAVAYSPHNRNHQADFTPRYGTNGRLELIEPRIDELKEPAAYRRNRNEAMLAPDPKSSEVQRLTLLIYGGFDPAVEYGPSNEHCHFSFTRNALYRRIRFTLDLSAYPRTSLIEEPRLFVVCKLPGRKFDCCEEATKQEGKTVKSDETLGQRWVWKFESFEQMMIGLHWKIDKVQLSNDVQTSREKLFNLLSEE